MGDAASGWATLLKHVSKWVLKKKKLEDYALPVVPEKERVNVGDRDPAAEEEEW